MSLFSNAFEDFLNHASADDMFQRAKHQTDSTSSASHVSKTVRSCLKQLAEQHRVSVDYYIQEFL